MSEAQPGVDDVTPLSDSADDSAEQHDQDSEPTLNAPQEGRTDGLVALEEDSDSDSDSAR